MEDPLVAARKRIDDIDSAIIALLNERARCALSIGAIKRERGLPARDAAREATILARVERESGGPLAGSSLRRIFAEIVAACRSLQE
ncbi:MAG: chorismate mutase [bacterium]|nr:chorismate mutase [candidate division KSB1 bacterium]MDH7560737.1 chorismate mutase [bacterium]